MEDKELPFFIRRPSLFCSRGILASSPPKSSTYETFLYRLRSGFKSHPSTLNTRSAPVIVAPPCSGSGCGKSRIKNGTSRIKCPIFTFAVTSSDPRRIRLFTAPSNHADAPVIGLHVSNSSCNAVLISDFDPEFISKLSSTIEPKHLGISSVFLAPGSFDKIATIASSFELCFFIRLNASFLSLVKKVIGGIALRVSDTS